MFRWFKKYFIPHEGNDNQPHVLRLETTVVILSLTLLFEVVFLVQAFFVFPGARYFSSIVAGALVDLTNSTRAGSHETTLAESSLLDRAATLKAKDMAAKGYFAHTSPAGVTPWYWFQDVGYDFRYAGENLAVNFVDSKDVMNAWMQSPAHRENILDSRFSEIGIGVAEGSYEGRKAVFVVQLFGTPAPAPANPGDERSIVYLNHGSTGSPDASGVANGVEGQAVAKVPSSPVVAFFTQVLANPHAMNTFLYVVLGTIVLLGLVLAVFVKIRIQYPPLIVHGAMMLLVLGSLLVLNQYFALAGAKVF